MVASRAPRIGATGLQKLAGQKKAWDWVRSRIDDVVEQRPSPVVGVSSLAPGADQVFANSVLDHGGVLEVVVPFPEYEARLAVAGGQIPYRILLAQTARRVELTAARSDEESYFAAGRLIVDSTDVLLAVWDGATGKGSGGTSDIVAYARRTGKPVIHIDPFKHQVSGLPLRQHRP